MIDLRPLIQPSFWFDLDPNALSPVFERGLFLFFGVMVVFGALARIVARNKKADRYLTKAYYMISQCAFGMGLLGLLFFFFSFEQVYLLGARFWFLLWFIGLLVWIYFIWRYTTKTIPELRARDQEKNRNDQYLPRKKRK